MNALKPLFVACVAIAAWGASAAEIENLGSRPVSLPVTEGGKRAEISLGSGEKAEFCVSGCFVTFPNGDMEALAGDERVEVFDGKFRILVDGR